ncbi:MAG: Gfo/Idh/MocA family oxidoreductase, partial [Eubacteriales bacterium]|nr:Gfo/Idh/MocA family oxidoreductase [Eubacteriales bacterium]
MKKIRVGLIGTGGIMNAIHIPGYLKSEKNEITAICDIDPAALKKTGDKLNIPEEARFLKYEDLIKSGLVDAVDIATPDVSHCEIASTAIKHNLPFSTEKPMGMNYREVKDVCDAAEKKGIPGMVCFSWHYRPFVRLMREQALSGRIGDVYHLYIRCIKDSGLWEGRRLEWRFDEKQSASGVMGDLSSHMIDIARFVGNEFISVCADAGIFVKERRELHSEKLVPVTTWDWCNIIAKMENGANATFQISRTTKHIGDWIRVEIYGSKGRLCYDNLNGKQTLEIQAGGQPESLTPDDSHDANQSEAFINIINGKKDGLEASLDNARKAQAVLSAAYKSV